MRVLPRALSLIVFVAMACAPAAPSAPPAQSGASSAPVEQRAEVQSLKVAFSAVYASMSPAVASGWTYMGMPLYDSLATFGPNYEPKPWIAERWELLPDNLTWRYTIRTDVKFSNGDPLTAEDVAFTLNTALESNWPLRSYFTGVTGATATDAKTVDIKTRAPDASIPNGAPYLWIVPKKYFEQVGADGFRQKPIGSGPYDLVEFVSAQKIVYKKRATPHAFRKPVLDEITFNAIVEATQKINGIRTGELDFSHMLLSAEQLDQAQKLDLQMRQITGDTTIGLLMPLGTAAQKSTPLTDKRVRQAINYAYDKETVAKVALRGTYVAAGQIGVPSSGFWDKDAEKPWAFDPAQAKRLLAEAGYPNGFKLQIDFAPAAMAQEVVLALQANLKDVGIEAEIRTHEASTFVDLAQGRGSQIRGDIFATTFSDNNGFFVGSRSLLGCGRPQPNNANLEFYCNPEWMSTFDLALQERDPAKRAELYRKANRLMRDDAMAVFFGYRSSYVVQSQKIRGFDPQVPNYWVLDSVYKIK